MSTREREVGRRNEKGYWHGRRFGRSGNGGCDEVITKKEKKAAIEQCTEERLREGTAETSGDQELGERRVTEVTTV